MSDVFFVSPFEKGESIRSALGFMSLSSRWGGILFPGITVLTRDLHHVKAMHSLAIEESRKRNPDWNRFRAPNFDIQVAKRVHRIMGKGVVEDYRQTMTYWQRYGFLFQHFHFQNGGRELDLLEYRNLIFSKEFSPRRIGPYEKNEIQREVRIKNATWYRKKGGEFSAPPTSESIGFLLRDPFTYWWLTGRRPPSANIPNSIRLARRLEFALIVWQTTFEAAVQCLRHGVIIPKAKFFKTPDAAIKEFYQEAVICKETSSDPGAYQAVVRAGLGVQNKVLANGHLKGAIEATEEELLKQSSNIKLTGATQFHNGKTIEEVAGIPSENLLPALLDLHKHYCHLQNKSSTIYVDSFDSGTRVNKIFDSLTLTFSGSRWGLFGYRFGVSRDLYFSTNKSTDRSQ